MISDKKSIINLRSNCENLENQLNSNSKYITDIFIYNFLTFQIKALEFYINFNFYKNKIYLIEY